MHHPPDTGGHARVLALVLTPRYAGCAVVDGFGLAPGSPESWDLRWYPDDAARSGAVRDRVARAAVLHRPTVAVLGVPLADDPRCELLRRAAEDALVERRVVVAERHVAPARRLITGPWRGRWSPSLAAAIVRGFFRDLAGLRPGSIDRYRRQTWNAVALALQELVLRAPRSAFAVARTEAFDIPTFADAVTASELRLHPVP